MNAYTKTLAHVINNAQEMQRNNGLTYIGTETLLYSILLTPKCDASAFLNDFGVNKDNFLPHYRKTFRRISVDGFTPKALSALYEANDISSSFKISYISTEHLLMAILRINDCNAVKILRALGVDMNNLYSSIFNSVKNANANQLENTNSTSAIKPSNLNKIDNQTEKENQSSPLSKLGYDLTLKAKNGKIDKVIGRNSEIDRVIQTLSRKTKNSPLLIGEAGVGKTAIVEGLALKINEGTVPDFLKDKILFSLDIGSLLAGTRYRGDFENRLIEAIDYALKTQNVIFFIDEIHNLVGAGGTDSGNLDAAEMLKPLLARGEIMLIGATTTSEYTRFIEKDPALERRFQPITVKEPSIEDSFEILKGIKSSFEAHHKVYISEDALLSACKLSSRYIPDRRLPDKAIDLIDEACSKKRVETTNFANSILKFQDKIKNLTAERDYLLKKGNLDSAKRLDTQIDDLIKKIQLENVKIYDKRSKTPTVTEKDIRELISVWTNIPITNLTEKDSSNLISLEDQLIKKVVGQNQAIELVSRSIRRSRANLKDPNKPIGSFLFVGKSGVGKSELSKALAECVFLSPDALIRFDMSEYNDKTSVNKLIGSAPGYVGYENEGLLTEKIRRSPYSVVLFDEIEKADNDVFDLLLQVLDEGRLTDSKGRLVSFKNALIILTSNVGVSEDESKTTIGFTSNANDLESKVKDAVKKRFRPEFLNRLDDIIVFNNLSKNDCYDIADMTINQIIKRLLDSNIHLTVENSAVDFIINESYSLNDGARPIKRAISKHIEDLLSDAIIDGTIKSGDKVSIIHNGNYMELIKK